MYMNYYGKYLYTNVHELLWEVLVYKCTQIIMGSTYTKYFKLLSHNKIMVACPGHILESTKGIGHNFRKNSTQKRLADQLLECNLNAT